MMPTMRALWPNAEISHMWGLKFARYGLIPRIREDHAETKKVLTTNLLGIDLKNPIGLAAGCDKNGESIDGFSSFGFGFVEIGTTTPEPQKGNWFPRVFRLPADRAIINRCGFNSLGHDAMVENLNRQADYIRANNVIVGVNLGKNRNTKDAAEDYIKGLKKFYDLDVVKYFVINISSPNTPNLRSLQEANQLESLLKNILEEKSELDKFHKEKKPLLVKIAPDLNDQEIENIAKVVNKYSNSSPQISSVDGLIISNTTVSRPKTLKSESKLIEEEGGLSGPPVADLSLEVIRKMYRLTSLPIIGVGGIETGMDAYNKIAAGASAVQFYTCMAYFVCYFFVYIFFIFNFNSFFVHFFLGSASCT